MKNCMVILCMLVFCVQAHAMLKLDSIFVDKQERGNESETAPEPYCGYSLVHPIIANWDTYSWLEKRNYQAFFQNVLATYRYNTATVDGKILIYFSPQYYSNPDNIKNIINQLSAIENRFDHFGMELKRPGMSVPYKIIVYVVPLNIPSSVIPLAGELLGDSYKGIPVVVINGNKLDYLQSNPCILSHAYAHSLLFSTRATHSLWFMEAVSAWMESAVNTKCENIEPFYTYRLEHPEIPIGAMDANVAIGDSNFIKLLNSKSDGIIFRVLNERNRPGAILERLNDALMVSTNRTLADYFEEYALINFYEALRSTSISSSSITSIPSISTFSLNQLSVNYAELSSASAESIRLLFDSEKKNFKIWVFVMEPELKFYISSLNLASSKPADIILPHESTSRVHMVIINSALVPDSISMQASTIYDYPFKLDSFEVSVGTKQVKLDWVTLRETETLGWIIYRKDEKDPTFRKINELLIPAVGNSNDPTHYVYVDKDVRPHSSYQYYIEVITKNLFPKKGPITSVKLP